MIKENILKLRAEGLTYNQIVKKLGCSKGTVSFHCGAGQKEKALKRNRDRRNKYRKYVQELKSKTPCTDCGTQYPYYVMEFDHLRDKSFTIATLANVNSLEHLIEEIAKCEIVCANCHKQRTWSRMVKTGGDLGPLIFDK